MRIDVSSLGLAALLLGVTAADSTLATVGDEEAPTGTTNNGVNGVIDFPGDQFEAPANLVRPSISPTKIFSWTVSTGTPSVSIVNLINFDNGQTVATATPTMTVGGSVGGAPSSTSAVGGNLPATKLKRDGEMIERAEQVGPMVARQTQPSSIFTLPSNFASSGGGSVSLELASRRGSSLDFVSHNLFNLPLYLEVKWKDGQRVGKSYSRLFFVHNPDIPPFTVATQYITSITSNATYTTNNGNDLLTGPVRAEESESEGQIPTATGGGIATPSQTQTGTGGTASTTPSGLVESGTAGSGLGTPAIAGIAVGAGVLGIAIIAFAIWFVMRRRRNQRLGSHQPVGYSSDGPTEPGRGAKWDKELPMVTSDSPSSRFAPDASGRLHDPHRASVVASAHDDAGSYAPYSDQAPNGHGGGLGAAGAPTSQTDLREGATRSPTPPIATRYAHLVEEGMTEDEIRRLEEEERALDAAIEVAGRSSRAA